MGNVPIINNLAVPIAGTVDLPNLLSSYCNFQESSLLMSYSLKVATLGPILAHITRLLLVSFRCFFTILAFSVHVCTKKLSGNFLSAAYTILYWFGLFA